MVELNELYAGLKQPKTIGRLHFRSYPFTIAYMDASLD